MGLREGEGKSIRLRAVAPWADASRSVRGWMQNLEWEKKDPRLKRGEVTNFRKNQSVGEYHQSKVAI